ncbi:MAG TPA: AAA family ATPase, partial [Ilumatobacteraceae bacterium]|nr:AAA family ATPase [Ilumatobacteraceae bacterium]
MAGSGLVTILFTDLVGSTALAQQLGDTAADSLRRDHFDQLRRAITVTGGTEVKTIGDAMMVSYNSASDAIAGAVAMQQRVHGHSAGETGAMQMRVGISAGDASFEEGDWFGTPVVEASRLCAAAEGDQILVTDIVRVLAGSRAGHELRSIGEVDGKGLTSPMSACEVVWERVAVGPDRLDVALPPQVEQVDVFGFVGRADQKDALWGAWKTVSSAGRLALFIGGEPGIGKTRLVKELCRDAHHQGGVVLWGACDEELALPYQPFVEAFRWLADVLPPDVLRDVSAREPVLLVLDDLHWARKPTLLLLRHLLKTPTAMNVLIVATYRDTDLDRSHPLAEMLADLRRQTGVERLVLRGLDEVGVQQFLARTAGHDLDERGIALAGAIARETEGNPFFVGEVLRHLSESGALVYRDSRWVSDKQLADIGIPQGVLEVIGRRLSNLDQVTNEVLATAAVIGREFELRTLTAVAGGSDRVLDALGAAETAGLVEPVNGRPGVYRFAHALVRSALYDELPTSRRLRLHRDIGHELERDGDTSARLVELARHFTEAAALGEVDKAVDYNRRAGAAAIDDLAFEEAAAYFEHALESLALQVPVDERVRAHLLFDAGNALHQISDARGCELLNAALESALALDDLELLARALIGLSADALLRNAADIDERSVGLYEAVLARRSELPDALVARTMAAYSREMFWGNHMVRRRALCDDALALARAGGDARVLCEVLYSVNLMIDFSEPDDFDHLFDSTTEMIEVAAGLDDSLVCNALSGRIVVNNSRGRVDDGDRDTAQAELLAERLRIPHHIARIKLHRTAQAMLAGRLDDTEVLIA